MDTEPTAPSPHAELGRLEADLLDALSALQTIVQLSLDGKHDLARETAAGCLARITATT